MTPADPPAGPRGRALLEAVRGPPDLVAARLRAVFVDGAVEPGPALAGAIHLDGRPGVSPASRTRLWAAVIAALPEDHADRAFAASRLAAALDAGAPLPCGGFDLLAPLGQGGMGQVWEARWALSDADLGPFAVKTIRASRLADPVSRLAFDREIRVVAAASHAGVVPILDLGAAPPADATGGRLEAGTPWFAMPRAAGSLAERVGRLRWPELRRVLAAVTTALAHVHALGIAHLDVKPENLLVRDALDPASLWLADFGQSAGRGSSAESGGTPLYMAPEQFVGDPALVGPPADLYALGGVAWELATGAPLFGDVGGPGLRDAHTRREPGDFRAASPMPRGFEGWVRGLLAKRPEDRPRSAPAALVALRALPDLDGDVVAAPAVGWRAAEVRPAGLAASPALLRFREAPLVGRTAERDALWAALERAEGEVIAVVGQDGIGRGRLGAWLAVGAAELGRADVWTASTSPPPTARPRLWWIADPDDVDGRLVAGASACGALVVTRARSLASLPPTWAELDVAELALGPLPDAEIEAIASSLVPLRAAARRRLVELAAGVPGALVDALRGAADRGALRLRTDGWTLDPAFAPTAAPAPVFPTPLCVAAALGRRWDRAEWRAACLARGLGDPVPHLVAWADAGFCTLDAGGATFATAALHRAAEAAATGADHAACAEVVADPVRRARHLLRSGQVEAAWGPWLDHLTRPTLEVADLVDAIVAASGVGPGDGRWARAAYVRASALDALQDYASLRDHCAVALASIEGAGGVVPPPLRMFAGRGERWAGDVEVALAWFATVVAPPVIAAQAALEWTTLCGELGRRDDVARGCARVAAITQDAADPFLRYLAGAARLFGGDAEGALDDLHAASASDSPGVRRQAFGGATEAYLQLGRGEDALAAALAARRESRDRHEVVYDSLHVAVALAWVGRFDEAAALASESRPSRGARMAGRMRAMTSLLSLLAPSEVPVEVRWAAMAPEVADHGQERDVVSLARRLAAKARLPASVAAALWAVGAPEQAEDDTYSTLD